VPKPDGGRSPLKRIICPGIASWEDSVLRLFLACAERAIAKSGRFRIALSGGKTPIPFFRRLARSGARTAMDWSFVDVFWVDERCVPPTDATSNFGVAWAECLSLLPIPAGALHRIEGELPPAEAASRYEAILRKYLGDTDGLDLVLLGVGKDGHTASLFPESSALEEANRWVVPVSVSADAPWRITMTLPILNRARFVLFLVRGREKRAAVQRIETDDSLPAGLIQPTSGQLVWLLDQDAAP
jgi:6-phosphogluconolactonase